ncbi:MAG: hypothetical protein LBV65_02520 [Desulfovibrio sp.]|nr:hypothetical protein [Desulfovibrio sp.]
MMKLIDLHTHTHASDGTDSPAALVAKAYAANLARWCVRSPLWAPRFALAHPMLRKYPAGQLARLCGDTGRLWADSH